MGGMRAGVAGLVCGYKCLRCNSRRQRPWQIAVHEWREAGWPAAALAVLGVALPQYGRKETHWALPCRQRRWRLRDGRRLQWHPRSWERHRGGGIVGAVLHTCRWRAGHRRDEPCGKLMGHIVLLHGCWHRRWWERCEWLHLRPERSGCKHLARIIEGLRWDLRWDLRLLRDLRRVHLHWRDLRLWDRVVEGSETELVVGVRGRRRIEEKGETRIVALLLSDQCLKGLPVAHLEVGHLVNGGQHIRRQIGPWRLPCRWGRDRRRRHLP
mmetsp:Transcript_4154/g.9041  ORF Transcript_4154/g.9041 Transcript_4154/m.9041 type:complete len:268 (+) Transcript_4154:874-1677(+)